MTTDGHVHLPRLHLWPIVAVGFLRSVAAAALRLMRGAEKRNGPASGKCGAPAATDGMYFECTISDKGRFSCGMLDRIGVGCFALDRDWRLNYLNGEFAAMCGVAAGEDALGESFFTLLEEEDVFNAADCSERLEAGGAVSGIFARRCQDGKVLHYMVMISPLRREGELRGAEGIMIDVTDRKLVEDRIRRHLNELAHVQRVNSMGKMVSELAHEIAQPLYAITNYAEACSQVVRSGRPLQAEMLSHWMCQVGEQANRAAEVVRRLRGFIHKSRSQWVEVDLNRRIKNVIHLMRPVAREHGVDIEFHAAESLPCVLADPIQIDQVLVNLMQNAVEAMENTPKNKRRIMIETAHEDGNMVRAAVRDMGQGIEEKDVNRIFDAFYSTKEEGMGIGLAICRSIMHEHGGRLWPTHNLHRGMTFHFSLPTATGG